MRDYHWRPRLQLEISVDSASTSGIGCRSEAEVALDWAEAGKSDAVREV
jgi:hypothetical protein